MGKKSGGNKNETCNYLWVMKLVYFFEYLSLLSKSSLVNPFIASKLHFTEE